MSPLRRLTSSAFLLLALVSTVVFGEAERTGCTMHGIGSSSTMSAAHDMSAHEMAAPVTSARAQPGMMPTHDSGTSHGGPDGDSHGCHCSCIGDCTFGAAIAPVPVSATLRVAAIVATPRALLDEPPPRPSPREPDRLLPFPNGPPVSGLL